LAGEMIARGGGNRMGLVVFAGDAYVQSPLTTDRRVLAELLGGVGAHMLDQGAGGGTAIGDALLVAAQRLAAAKVEGRDQAVVLITDGESNLGFDPVAAARHLAAAGVRVHAIGVGGTEPVEVWFEGERVGGEDAYLSVLDDRQLPAIAAAAGGRFFRATDVGALEAVFDELSRLESAPLDVRTVEVPRSWGPALAKAVLSLFAAHLFLAGMAARRPYR
jgi:Ca-activated chloride channel family protein